MLIALALASVDSAHAYDDYSYFPDQGWVVADCGQTPMFDPHDDEAHERVAAEIGNGIVFKIMVGFAPQRFLRLDPVETPQGGR